jgi:hypothetical protein
MPRGHGAIKDVAAGKSSMNMTEILCLNLNAVGKCGANPMTRLDVHNGSGLTVCAIECEMLF